MAEIRLSSILSHMKQRCYNKNSPDYKNYGARGIEVCKEWRENSKSFVKWAKENGYADNLTIDRIDVNGNYCPENCRWITIEQQQRNRTNNKRITWNGETHVCSEWDEILGYTNGTVRLRLARGWSIDRTMTQPMYEMHYNYNKKGVKKTKIIFPGGEEKFYPSVSIASKETGISVSTLNSIAKDGDTIPRRKYKGYKVFIDVVVYPDDYTEK